MAGKEKIMPRIEVNREAPAVGSAEARIEAPIETVWGILSDLEKWPKWNKSVARIRVDGPIEAGTSFAWASGGVKVASRLEEVARPARIAWTGKMFGVRAVHVWNLVADGLGTKVRTEESFAGWLARLLPGLMKKTLANALAQGVADLKAAAESQPRN
jgi:uncharacterized protein YndB with AHSA1/START domain